MSGRISGIYVEIRGDYNQLKEDLSQAKAIVTQQSKGMSDALNNALSPDQIKKSVDKMVGSLNTLSNASKLTSRGFKDVTASLKGELQDYTRLVGVSEKEFAKLQSRMLQTSAAKAQETALRNIAKAADLSAKEVAQLGKQMGVSASSIAAVNGAAKSSASAMSMLGGAARAALAYFSVQTVVEFGRAIRDAGLAMDSLQRSFFAVTGSQSATAETLSFLRKEAGRLGQNFYALAPEFKNVMAAARGTAMEGEEVRKMFSAIAGASTALGLSADDTHGTLRALQQMMSKGTIQAEELRGQLGERLPGALNLMAKAMGVSTAGLNKMMEDGKLLADDALPKLTAEIERVYGAAAETAALESGQAAVNRFSQEWTDLKTNLYNNDAFVAATNAITDMVAGINALIEGRGSVLETLGAMQSNNGMLSAMFPTRFAYDFFSKYADSAKDASLDVKKSFTATWQELERLNIVHADNFIQKEEEKAAVVAKKNSEILDQFRKQSQTQLQKLTEDKEKFLAAAKGDKSKQAEIEKWYAGEVAKLNEKSTKKFADEQKKQLAAHKKAREEMLKGGKAAEKAIDQYWLDYENRRVDAIAESTAKTVKLREEEAKAAADAARKIAEEQEAAAQKVMDRIQEGTADVFYDMFQDIGKGWETLWTSMKNWALRTLAELAARAATVQIVVPIMTSMTGTSSATQAVQAITGGQGGFSPSSLSSLVQPGSMLSKIPGMDFVTGMLGTTLPGTATALTGAFSSVGAGAGMYATGLGFGSGAVANGALQGMTLGGQSLATAAPAMTSGLTLGSALGMGSLGGLGYSLLGSQIGLPQNQWTGLTASAGGALGAWGGAALASAAGGAAAGAAAGSVVPVIGTVIGAIIGGLAGSLIGGEEQSPSVIYQAQQMGWGSVDPTTYQFHTKDGAKSKTGNEISTALAAVAGGAFQQVEAAVAALGEQYVDILKESTVEWGRNAGGSWSSWDFGADHNFEELFAKAQADLTGQILKAAEGAFTAAGKDLATGDEAANALSMLSEKAAGSFRALQDAIAAGVQDGNVEAFVAQIQQFQTAMQTVNAVWDSVSQASAELVKPLTQYEQAQRQVNAQYDVWIAQLEALGFAAEKVAKIDADRAEVLANLAVENKKAIDSVLRDSAQTAVPLSEFAAAQQRINDQFDGWIEQLEALAATEDQLAQVEADRAVALANLAAAGAGADRVISDLTKTLEGAIADVQSALKSMASNVRANLNAAYNAERSAIRAALDGVLDGMRLEIDGLNSAMKSAKDAASAWRSVSDTLSRTEIIPMTLPQAMAGIDAMITGAFRGQAPDADELSKIVGVLSGIEMRDYATRADYDTARGAAASKIETLAGIAGVQVGAADRQLEALESQRAAIELQMQEAQAQADAQLDTLNLTYENALEQLDALEGIEKYSGTMDKALAMVVELTNTYGTTQASLLNAQLALAYSSLDAQQAAVYELQRIAGLLRSSSDDTPGFAAGGYHSGGLRIVGERGPELEATGPSRIWSASDTRAMLSGGGGSDAAEIRALREDMRAQGRAMVATQQRMTKLLERWNIDGMPEVRTA